MLRSRFVHGFRSMWLWAWLALLGSLAFVAQADDKSGGGGPPPGPPALGPNQTLGPNESVSSNDGRFHLVYQGDGNLVLYRWDWAALWSSNTAGSSAGYAVMQGDGNLVVYNGSGSAVWHSGTWGHPGAFLALRNDGNAVIYGGNSALWATHTCCW